MICVRRCERADLGALEWDGSLSSERPLIAATFARAELGVAEMLVAEEFAIVGQVWIDFDRDGDCATLWALRVKPACWGRGIATGLITTAEQLVAARAIACTITEVDPENQRARELFEHRGYTLARVHRGRLVLRKQITHARAQSQPSI